MTFTTAAAVSAPGELQAAVRKAEGQQQKYVQGSRHD
jgi:hypothetical protein